MKKSILFASFLFAFLLPSGVFAQNPFLPLWEFIPDGEPHVFEDPDKPGEYRVYVYGSHDMLETNYCGLDQVVWSASVNDLTNWRYDGISFELKKDANGNLLNSDGKCETLYAPDVVETSDFNGKKTYYLYPNVVGPLNNVVAKSNRPDGPFEVCNWDPQNPKKAVGPIGFDPGTLVDTDGRVYCYWGFKHPYAAELDPVTMSTVKPGTEIIDGIIPGSEEDHTFRFFEASSIRKIKDKYVYIYSRWTNDGEEGLPRSNYTLAYCYSNSPLGPWTYGGTIIDGRGIEHRPDGSSVATACPNGNTHGSIYEINGKWWVFYHRQTSTNDFARQAMVAPITLEVQEGEDGYVRISQGELTSEGFRTEGLDPFTKYQAGIACYYTGPKPAYQAYPNTVYSGSYVKSVKAKYDGKIDPYDSSINHCAMVNNTSGSVVGYKYFNFSDTYGKSGMKQQIEYIPEEVAGRIDVYLDRPSLEEGGVKSAQWISAQMAVRQ